MFLDFRNLFIVYQYMTKSAAPILSGSSHRSLQFVKILRKFFDLLSLLVFLGLVGAVWTSVVGSHHSTVRREIRFTPTSVTIGPQPQPLPHIREAKMESLAGTVAITKS